MSYLINQFYPFHLGHNSLMEDNLAKIISDNVGRMCEKRNLKSDSLGRKAGIDQKTAYNLLNPEKSGTLPTTRTMDAIRKYFKIEFWPIVFPKMPVDLMGDQRLTKAIQQLADCTPESRDKIFERIEELSKLDKLERR